MRYFGLAIALVALVLLTACAGTTCHAPVGDSSLTPSAVSAGGAHEGEIVQWGGVLTGTRNLADSTELEVVAYPLDKCGRPLTASGQTGRFVIVRPGFLETADYRSGRRVTATGRVKGVREGRLGEAPYAYPLLESYKVQLWPEDTAAGRSPRPWVTIGIGGGSGGGVYGGVGGGVGVQF
jgi:outer membrane lipoprotein